MLLVVCLPKRAAILRYRSLPSLLLYYDLLFRTELLLLQGDLLDDLHDALILMLQEATDRWVASDTYLDFFAI